MPDLVLNDIDRLVADLIAARAAESGRTPEDVAKEALLKGLLWSPAERSSYAAKVRAMTPATLGDSVDLVREVRNAR